MSSKAKSVYGTRDAQVKKKYHCMLEMLKLLRSQFQRGAKYVWTTGQLKIGELMSLAVSSIKKINPHSAVPPNMKVIQHGSLVLATCVGVTRMCCPNIKLIVFQCFSVLAVFAKTFDYRMAVIQTEIFSRTE